MRSKISPLFDYFVSILRSLKFLRYLIVSLVSRALEIVSLFDCFGSISRALRFLRYLIVSRAHLDLSFI